MIIDVHTHAFPDELAERALDVLAKRAGVAPFTDGTCDGLTDSTRAAGITLSVVAPIATKPSQARAINTWAVEMNEAYPNLLCFGSVHPAQDDWAQEIEQLVADGIRGVKFHPDYQDFYVDEPRLFPIYHAFADAGLVVLFHAGIDIGLPPPVHCPPDRLARALDAVPEMTAIASHMGGYAQWRAVARYLVGRPVYFDTAYSCADMGVEQMLAIIEGHGADRVLFGTDSPWTDQAVELRVISGLPLSDEARAAILGENARRLLRLPSEEEN
jgi:predicted TIM-barrel fold metal-dependent hydrolase